MKYISLFVLSLFLLSGVFFSCKKKDANEPNGIGYDSISVSRIYHLENDTAKPSCSIQVNYIHPATYADAEVLAKLHRELNYALLEDESYESLPADSAVNKFIADFIENYKKDAQLRFSDMSDFYDLEDYYSFYKSLNTKILYDKGGLLSYQISSRDSKRESDTITTYRNVVINIETGNTLTETDIFVPEYRSPLSHLITLKLMEQNKVQKAEALEEMGYFGIMDITTNNNFYVDSDGITYIFNPGECSAVILGEIRIPFSYDELFDILKPRSPISHLSGK